jgi:phage shock protein C
MDTEGKTLRKSRDQVFGGICAGIADYIGWPAKNFRILYVLISILSAAFPGTIVYIILWFTMPDPE